MNLHQNQNNHEISINCLPLKEVGEIVERDEAQMKKL
jgi:hypothetical protein